MGVLDNVIAWKQIEEDKANKDIASIAPAIQSFIENKNKSILMDLEKQKVLAGLAPHGMTIDDFTGKVKPDESLRDSVGQNVTTFNPATGEFMTTVVPKGRVLSTPNTGTSTREDAIAVAQGIIDGAIPADPQSSSFRDRTAVNAELARQGYDLNSATLDFQSAKKFYNSMNSEKQIRLRQAISSVEDAMDGMEKLNEEYKRGGFGPLNKAQLIANSKGVGQQATLATEYLTQLGVIQDELAQVFMGGNSPTERFLDQAQNLLRSDFNEEQLGAVLKNLRTNLKYRKNAINNAGSYSPSNKTAEGNSEPPQSISEKSTSSSGWVEGKVYYDNQTKQKVRYVNGSLVPVK